MINYLRAFLPNLSERVSSFRELLKSMQCRLGVAIVNQLIVVLRNIFVILQQVLKNDERKYDLKIKFNASEKALGCFISKIKNIINFASRCLSKAEVSYAQIKKEMFAFSFACSKFHSLIYRKKIKIFTDHQPLVSIMLKGVHKIPNNRSKRLRLKCLLW